MTNLSGGFFITLYDEETLKLYLNQGIFGFLMKPTITPSSRSKHYQILSDYSCSREGSDIFFFLKRKIIYGGKIFGNDNYSSFYINGKNSHLGNKIQAPLFWDESNRSCYNKTTTEGVFTVRHSEKAQPFIFQFSTNDNTGKYICSDDLYFELGNKYRYPLPSNSMQKMGFCTLTPGEVTCLLDLINNSTDKINYNITPEITKNGNYETKFDKNLVSLDDSFINEAQLEFTILSSLEPFKNFLQDNYILCRQVPLSPFKPMNMDRADICLYNISCPIQNGTIPNIIIELKKEVADKNAYKQIIRYLRWLEKITTPEEFINIKAYIFSKKFSIKNEDIDSKYNNKIKLYSITEKSFISIQ